MSKTTIGTLFICAGIVNAGFAWDWFYNHTLGFLLEHHWVKPPEMQKIKNDELRQIFGRKMSILLYSFIFIIIGLFILWNRST